MLFGVVRMTERTLRSREDLTGPCGNITLGATVSNYSAAETASALQSLM